MANILDPKFRYTPAAQTDIKKTFKRLERERLKAIERDAANERERISKVRVVKAVR